MGGRVVAGENEEKGGGWLLGSIYWLHIVFSPECQQLLELNHLSPCAKIQPTPLPALFTACS